MSEALVRIYKLFAFDVPVTNIDVEDPYDAIPIAERILDSTPLKEALDKFDGEEVFDHGEDSVLTHFNGEDMLKDDEY